MLRQFSEIITRLTHPKHFKHAYTRHVFCLTVLYIVAWHDIILRCSARAVMNSRYTSDKMGGGGVGSRFWSVEF